MEDKSKVSKNITGLSTLGNRGISFPTMSLLIILSIVSKSGILLDLSPQHLTVRLCNLSLIGVGH